MATRLLSLSNQITQNQVLNTKDLQKSDDDIVIVSYARTALAKANRGGFKDTATEVMLSEVMKAAIKNAKNLKESQIDDICIGNVNQNGAGEVSARLAQFLAGINENVPVQAVNRLCSSGLQSVITISNSINAKEINIGLAGGVESMTHYPMSNMYPKKEITSQAVFEHPKCKECYLQMGITSENVAAQHNITREQQDQFAYESFRKAVEAQKAGWLQQEITPVKTTIKDKDGKVQEIVVDKDEGIRPTSLEQLAKLKPAFSKEGRSTGGNSSQMTDGAAAVILARRSVAKQLNLPILGRLISSASIGVPPNVMGIGPAFAIPLALQKCGLKIDDIDIYEINEAFASQALYCVQKLNIDPKKVNPRGGAIALGHPLGATGSRQLVTLFNELKRTNKKYGVISMCVGTGMGVAAVFENE